MDRKRFVLRMFPATVAALLLCGTLHEGGHAAGAAKCFAFAFYVMTAFSVLPWILFPAAGIFPEGDDITEFMASSAMPRWAVSVGAAVLASLFVYTASPVFSPRPDERRNDNKNK